MLNATVGVRRVLTRLRPARADRVPSSVRFHRRSAESARDLRVRAGSLAATAQVAPVLAAKAASPSVHRSLITRLGPDAAVPLVVALIVSFAAVFSWLPGLPARGATGGTSGDGSQPRIAIGGAGARDVAELPSPQRADQPDLAAWTVDSPSLEARRLGAEAAAAEREVGPPVEPTISGQFLPDGTLLKPIAVTTTLPDGKDLLRTYTVAQGDSLTGIADRFGVSMMTVWWANKLKSKDDLRVGQTLVIPPVDGLVVTVREGDTLDSLAKAHRVAADEIYETNGLEDRILVAGQTLILPGARGAAIPVPAPKPKPKATAPSRGGGGTVRPPATYSGGTMAWPVVGGGNTISQRFHYGHYGLDIAADHGSTVRAAAAGTVTFAGWKNNGGGYQVWIAHGSGLYTTYNHMSAVSVGVGQRVGRAQQVGRVGSSGYSSGPHLHFEVWRGPIWNGGTRVNPLAYL